MELLLKLAKIPVFTIENLNNTLGNEKTSYSQLYRWIKKDLVRKVRKNLYSVVNISTGDIVANRYQIACAINSTAYLSHHSAFEYYGLGNQIFNELYVSSNIKFNNFEYDNVFYKFVASKMEIGIVKAKNTTGVRLTDLERTVIDSIHDINKISGIEELLNCLEGIRFLDEKKLMAYLDVYHSQGLYQKTGYILDHYKDHMHLSKGFIDYCKSKVGESRRYLVSEMSGQNSFNREWNLMVPIQMFNFHDIGENNFG